MDDLEAMVRAMRFDSGKNSMTIEEIAAVQPGLARIMPEIGARAWKLYYAARAGNWPMARYQYAEIVNLFELGAFMRPKHADAINQYLAQHWKVVGDCVRAEDFAKFDAAFHGAIDAANAFHALKDKPFIKWRLPSTPPPDLDLG